MLQSNKNWKAARRQAKTCLVTVGLAKRHCDTTQWQLILFSISLVCALFSLMSVGWDRVRSTVNPMVHRADNSGEPRWATAPANSSPIRCNSIHVYMFFRNFCCLPHHPFCYKNDMHKITSANSPFCKFTILVYLRLILSHQEVHNSSAEKWLATGVACGLSVFLIT